ncbi:MAG: adaptor protein MecA [Lachnospiraceae bacterium]|nr:adaptor protein MecA [Lachnospiraceae bacterium]
MKIEKVNDHQIRCTLTKADLIDRQLKISELAYGTEKAKNLFRDMMQQASFEFGFEAEDIPLMIEAIPLNSECIVLIITKVEDPEELDTRFSKFAPSVHSDSDEEDWDETDALLPSKGDADDILDLFKKLHDTKIDNLPENPNEEKDAKTSVPPERKKAAAMNNAASTLKLYSFPSFQVVTRAAHVLEGLYEGENTLYKDISNDTYKILLEQGSHTVEDFTRVCNTLSEYGKIEKCTDTNRAFLEEHLEVICQKNALQALTQI